MPEPPSGATLFEPWAQPADRKPQHTPNRVAAAPAVGGRRAGCNGKTHESLEDGPGSPRDPSALGWNCSLEGERVRMNSLGREKEIPAQPTEPKVGRGTLVSVCPGHPSGYPSF